MHADLLMCSSDAKDFNMTAFIVGALIQSREQSLDALSKETGFYLGVC